ncbi:hypothetical protein [Ramlibacter tataouinensis]|nr:hypothetical protein [Ramlibacter tataouinensis]
MRLSMNKGLRAATAAALAAVLLAACGGGGGDPGECVSGSAQVCAEGR